MTEMNKPKSEREKIKETKKRTTARLIKEIAKSEGILAAIGDGISVLDRTFKILYQNQAEKDMMGVHVGEFCYKAYAKKQGICGGCPIVLTFKDGRIHTVQRELQTDKGIRYAEITASPLKDPEGKIIAGIEVVRDITERKQIEDKLREEEERYRKQFEEAIDAIFLADIKTGMLVDCNIAASKLVEREKSEIIGKHQSFLHPARDIKDGVSKTFKSHMIGESSELLEDKVITKSGQIKDVAIRASKMTIEGKEVMQGIFRDITERKSIEEELNRLATTDTLTGALNRTRFQETIEKEIERFKRYNQPLFIMLFDIDHFKEVNDRYGHGAGDYVLKTIAGIVRENIRKIDYFVRWGGEEFIILSSGTQLDKAHALAERIRKVIENYKFENVGKVTVSFGVTEFKERDTQDSFIKRADDAMYEAKKKGKNRVEVSI